MVETRDRSEEHANQTIPYGDANGLEHYAFDDLQNIGAGFEDFARAGDTTSAASISLHICFIDVSAYRSARIAEYLRSHGHEVTEYQTADDACDALLTHQYDLMLIGSVGSARAPLIRTVKDSAAGAGSTVRVAVISTNDSISRELAAAGADEVVDGNTETPQFNAKLIAPFRYGKQAPRSAARPATRPTMDAPQPVRTVPTEKKFVAPSAPHATPKAPKKITANPRVTKPAVADDHVPLLRNAVTQELDFESLRKQVQEHIAHPEPLHFPSPAKEEPPHFPHAEHEKPADDDPTKAHHDPLFETFKKLKSVSDGIQARSNSLEAKLLPSAGMPKKGYPEGLQQSSGKFPSVLAMGSALAVILLSNLHHL